MPPSTANVRKLILLIVLGASLSGLHAQFRSATIVIDGLTCSMCSFGVEKSIRKLGFVEDVKMDLNSNTAQVSFVEGAEVMITELARKVTDAGFSVRKMQAVAGVSHAEIPGNADYLVGQSVCHFLSEVKASDGEVRLTFIGKEFMARQDWKKWRDKVPEELNGLAASPFLQAREYCFVTL